MLTEATMRRASRRNASWPPGSSCPSLRWSLWYRRFVFSPICGGRLNKHHLPTTRGSASPLLPASPCTPCVQPLHILIFDCPPVICHKLSHCLGAGYHVLVPGNSGILRGNLVTLDTLTKPNPTCIQIYLVHFNPPLLIPIPRELVSQVNVMVSL